MPNTFEMIVELSEKDLERMIYDCLPGDMPKHDADHAAWVASLELHRRLYPPKALGEKA